jgi:hypothetical protein
MKKSTISLITSALFLSIGVHAAPVAHNNAAVQIERDVTTAALGLIIIVGSVTAAVGYTATITVINRLDRKKFIAKRKKKAAKKAAKAALRKRAEAEYNYRHASHKRR